MWLGASSSFMHLDVFSMAGIRASLEDHVSLFCVSLSFTTNPDVERRRLHMKRCVTQMISSPPYLY